jgi:hypothetical protein
MLETSRHRVQKHYAAQPSALANLAIGHIVIVVVIVER